MSSENISAEVRAESERRRTFAIISHPDAGKTTLTEKLLLYAGMVRTAGMVRGRKAAKHASSDWMSMEQERGISITASAMQFEYKGFCINVLDTPGHQDFSEDTYRTLTAADCALMVIDATGGVQEQTIKLFKVCRLRSIPIITFINKFDLPGRDPFELVSEVEEVLGINGVPMNWPIGSGKSFMGVAETKSDQVMLFEKASNQGAKVAKSKKISREELDIDDELRDKLEFDLELISEAGDEYDQERFLAGEITPVFFGSALTNFGIEPFYDSFVDLAPSPRPRQAIPKDDADSEITIEPASSDFSAYVFKIQANLDPKHRDSMAYLRVCSGRFERDEAVKHVASGQKLRLSRSHAMFGGGRSTLDYAYPGDVFGVVNPGAFAIGDTITSGKDFSFLPLPTFPPEVVAEIRPKDVMKRKAFDKGLAQLGNEGAVLVLRRYGSTTAEPMVAAVGNLQFEVLQHRLKAEYGVETILANLPYSRGAWLIGDPDTFRPPSDTLLAKTESGRLTLLYTSDWQKGFAEEQNGEHKLSGFLEEANAA